MKISAQVVVEDSARALAQLSRYADWRRRPEHEQTPEFDVDDRGVEEILDRSGEGFLPSPDTFRILECYRIPLAPWRWDRGAVVVVLRVDGGPEVGRGAPAVVAAA